MATQDDYIRTALRVPPGLHAQIHDAARVNNRTFNSEIVARLQATFDETVVTSVEAQATSSEGSRFEFNADEIAGKVMELLEKKAASRADRLVIIGNLGRLPELRAEQDGGDNYQPRGNEPYGPKKSGNAGRGKKT